MEDGERVADSIHMTTLSETWDWSDEILPKVYRILSGDDNHKNEVAIDLRGLSAGNWGHTSQQRKREGTFSNRG